MKGSLPSLERACTVPDDLSSKSYLLPVNQKSGSLPELLLFPALILRPEFGVMILIPRRLCAFHSLPAFYLAVAWSERAKRERARDRYKLR
jgi:hypothetical protein